jgi:hypothetical protein
MVPYPITEKTLIAFSHRDNTMRSSTGPWLDPLLADLHEARGLQTPATELDLNVGKRCRVRTPRCLADEGDFVAAYVQTDYLGALRYRIVPDTPPGPHGHFGRLADPENLVWLGDGEHAPGVLFQRICANAAHSRPSDDERRVRRVVIAQLYRRFRMARHTYNRLSADGDLDRESGGFFEVREAWASLQEMKRVLMLPGGDPSPQPNCPPGARTVLNDEAEGDWPPPYYFEWLANQPSLEFDHDPGWDD